jgi:uncharacterized pyridoxamine 5'-phosphate oxidase family protein
MKIGSKEKDLLNKLIGTKNLYSQIKRNPRVEAAFSRNANDPVNFETLRVTGSIEVFHSSCEEVQFQKQHKIQIISN